MWGAVMKLNSTKAVSVVLSLVLLFTTLAFIVGKNKIFTDTFKSDNTGFIVIVDAGHGGEDGGAVAPDNSFEKDYNLDIALKLEAVLKLYGCNVVMTRKDDIMTCDENLKTQRQKKVSDIRNRLAIINKYNNAVFVSVHQNKFSDSKQKGTQVFYSPNNLKSKNLADCIQKSVVLNLQKDNKRLTKKSGTDIFLLYHSTIPSVLVECGFLSNKDDLALLKKDEYRREIAYLIANGIIEFYKTQVV